MREHEDDTSPGEKCPNNSTIIAYGTRRVKTIDKSQRGTYCTWHVHVQ